MSNAAPMPSTGGLNKLVNELLELSKGNLTSLAEATTEWFAILGQKHRQRHKMPSSGVLHRRRSVRR